MNAITTILSPVVTVKDGIALADSRDVAAAFGKLHKHVLEKIDSLLSDAPQLNGPNFRPVLYEDAKGEMRRTYEMDRSGFSLLAMRFTGKKALQWQIAYVAEFERMEAALHAGISVIDDISPKARSTIGGIVRGVTHKELAQVLPALVEPLLDRLVSERLASDRLKVVHGVSALQIAEMAGYPKGRRPRGMTQFISARVTRYHEDRKVWPDRSPYGSGRVKIYNEALARRWLAEGAQQEIDHYAAQRKGQGALKLVRP
jgi:Rha family phage regulatory protein